MRPIFASLALVVPALVLLPTLEVRAAEDQKATQEAGFRHEAPAKLYQILKVADGDTVHIQYDGEYEKLRLLSVDTEEKFDVGPTKPATVFGQECAVWAENFFKEGDDFGQIGLAFPGGEEKRDIYGRLLCHVVLADGTDFNLKLVELGKSPYFNKYGNSRICHEAFVKAQKAARDAKLGIWDPKTNAPEKKGAPSASRPYERLMSWWDARALAIDNFRAKNAEDPEMWIDAEDPKALAASLKSGKEVHVFCSINPRNVYDEKDGSRTFLMRAPDKRNALRIKIPADALKAHDKALNFEQFQAEFEQNYLFVSGKIVRGDRGYDLISTDPQQWSLAGPAPRDPGE